MSTIAHLPAGRVDAAPEHVAGSISFDCSNRAPLVAPGEYDVVYVHHETKFIFKTPKVFIWFRIVSPGDAYDTNIYRAYRVRALMTKQGKNGGLKVLRGSDIYHDLVRILDIRTRPDRVSASALRGFVCRVSVRTVIKDHKQRVLPDWDKYSVIDKLLFAVTQTKQLVFSR